MTTQSVGRNGIARKAILLVAVTAVMLLTTIGVALAAHSVTTVTFPDFTNPADDFQLNGSAVGLNPNGDDVLRLTSGTGQSGSAFLYDAIDLSDSASFSTVFSFRIHNPVNGGADGLAFVIQPNNNTAGGGGGGIGYQGIANSLGIEFDNWHNGGDGTGTNPCDINGNHVGINVDGLICSEVQASLDSLGTLDAGAVWHVWVDYDGGSGRLEVRVSLGTTRPSAAFISYNVDLEAVLGTTDAFVGFSSGSGWAGATHDIVAWQFSDDITEDIGGGTKGDILEGSGVTGKGVVEKKAPGLDKEFNPKSKAGERAGKK